jgi:hypothetical protein
LGSIIEESMYRGANLVGDDHLGINHANTADHEWHRGYDESEAYFIARVRVEAAREGYRAFHMGGVMDVYIT